MGEFHAKYWGKKQRLKNVTLKEDTSLNVLMNNNGQTAGWCADSGASTMQSDRCEARQQKKKKGRRENLEFRGEKIC